MARRMVTEWGLSEEMGPLKYGSDGQDSYMGHAPKDISDDTARKIDSEIRRIVEDAYQRAKSLLEEHIDALHTLAKALLEYETLSGDDITRVLNGEKLVREEDAPTNKDSGPSGSVPTGGINIGKPKPQGS
jgi:cell division protease FtsH